MHQLNAAPRGHVHPSTRPLIKLWRVKGVQDACVGLKAARDDGREYTGAERREALADPGRLLNCDALLHTRTSHESIIHGPREHVSRAQACRSVLTPCS